ncbi:uncharacterized protein LOC113359756 [Papaver somniferum]|uniref:uncharacterized protein LOC113359756 n=1 Tax=Papaver somniferum TaxID=3469 RepID=UPI000E7056A3|nr:uncharacterized protein LOC113359756 [Papaver somniferum]
MNLYWRIQNGSSEMEKYFQAKYQYKKGEWIKHYKKSSIWPGLKWVANEVHEHTRWLVGNGSKILVGKDIQIKEKALNELYPDNPFLLQYPDMKVADILLEGEWVIPNELLELFEVNELPVVNNDEDKRVWCGSISGEFSVASAVECIRKKYPKQKWTNQVWKSSIHPNISSNIWKLVRGACPTGEKMRKRKFCLASRCVFCKNAKETLEHILWNYDFSEIIWKCLGDMFCFVNPRSFEGVFKIAKGKSPAIQEVWKTTAFITLQELWFLRKKCVYENEKINDNKLKTRIMHFTADCDVGMKATMWNSTYDLQVLKNFGLKCRKVKATRIQELYFYFPERNYLLLCIDGASKGNPGTAGFGYIGRNNSGDCVIAVAGGLGLATNYYAEVVVVLCAREWGIQNGFFHLIFRSDT